MLGDYIGFGHISIPHGTIKSRITRLPNWTVSVISIPHGTIKSVDYSIVRTPQRNFNTSWYN